MSHASPSVPGDPERPPGNDPEVGDQRRRRLQAAAESLGLPLPVDVVDRLMAYLQLLQRWNRVYNLTALRDPDEMLSHHLVDCLAVVPPMRRMVTGLRLTQADGGLRVLDVGSGGGLPGVVLAAVEPTWQVSCVDTVAKKASFIRQVSAELGLRNLQGVHGRVEGLPSALGRFDVVTSRAFASLADFTRLSQHALAEPGVWMAMKGRQPDDEQAALPPGAQVFHVEQLQVPGLAAQRCLVWLRRANGV